MKKNIKKKIYVVNITEEGRFGGPARRIVNVAKELNKMNVKTKIVMPYLDSNYFSKYARKNNVKFRKLNLTRLTFQKKYLFLYIFRFFKEVFDLCKLLKNENPDIVHINGSYQFKSCLAAYLSKKKIVWHLNNQREIIIVKLVFDILKKIKPMSFIVASQKAKNYFIPNISRDTLFTEIHAPIVGSNFKQKRNYNLKKNRILIGTTTNLSPQKDLITFVKAAYKIHKKHPNVQFHVGGAIRNSQKKYFKKVQNEIKKLKIGKKIKFYGFVSNVPLFLSRIDIFINSSAWEGSPTAVWEALASGLPVATTDVGSTNFYVGKMKAGLVSGVGDYDNIANNVLKLIKNYKLRKKYGLKAKLIANKFLNVERCAKLHKSHYQKFIEN